MALTLADAEELSPKRLQNRIVRQIQNTQGGGQYISTEVFPLHEMGASEEVYHRLSNLRAPMPTTSIGSESPTGGIEGLEEDKMTVQTLKEKISPEKGVNATLNSQQDILNVAGYIADSLRVDLARSRSFMTWRAYGGEPGIIGAEGATAHPKIPTSHVLTPSTAFSDTANSTPHDVFMDAARAISEDGSAFDQLGGQIDAYVPTSVVWDLKKNDDLEQRFSGVDVQNLDASALSEVLPINGQVHEIRTKVPRTNGNGEPIDENGNVVKAENAVDDNILEPWDDSAGAQVRNIALGMFGEPTAVQPWYPERLADHIGATPSGLWSVNTGEGFLVQSWTQHDPAISWRKIASETGFEVIRGENLAVIQDV